MAKLTRKNLKLFGSTAGVGDIRQFGSLAAAAPLTTTDPETIIGLSNYNVGWFGAIIGEAAAALEDRNALDYLHSYHLNYLMQTGVPEWNTNTTYYTGSIVNDGSGNLFISTADSNAGNPLTDAAHWKKNVGQVPIGAVIATFPNLTGAYTTTATTAADQSGWVLCQGQTVADTSSPMNGQVVPNINNSIFLMGSTAAGNTGGSNTTSHTHVFTHNHQTVAVSNSGANQGLWTMSTNPGTQNLTSFAVQDGNSLSMLIENADATTGGTYPRLSVTTSNLGYSAGAINCPSGSGATATTSGPSVTDNRPAFLSAVYLMRIK